MYSSRWYTELPELPPFVRLSGRVYPDGKIELIQVKVDTLEIVDFKGTTKPNQNDERHLLRFYRRQLGIYASPHVEQRVVLPLAL